MSASAGVLAPRRERLLTIAAFLSPLALFIAARLFGYTGYLKLAGIALAGVSAAAAVFLLPRWGLWFLLFYVYSGLGMYMPFNAAAPVTMLVLAAVLLELVRGGKNRLDDGLFWAANAFFILVALQSMLFAKDPGLSFHDLGAYLKMVLITYVVVQLVRTPADLRMLAYVVFVAAVATVVFGVANLALGVGSASDNYVGGVQLVRFTGGHENPNRAAAYMCSALPLGLFAVRYCASRPLRVLFVAGLVSLIVAIFWTFSRSVIVPFAFILGAVMIREVRSRRSYLLLVVLLVVGILLAPRYYWDRVFALGDAIQTGGDWSVYMRMLALRTAWTLFLANPLTGIGLGNFIVAGAYQVFIRIVVHNSYLEILVGTGIFGLAAFLLVLGSGVRHSVSGARRQWLAQPPWVRSLSFYLCLSAASISLSAFFGTMPFRYPLWIPTAGGLVIGNLLRTDRSAVPSP